MAMGILIRAMAALAVILSAMPAWAEIYKWVNEDGVTTYSNSPPSGTKAKKFETVPDRISVIPQDRAVMRTQGDAARSDARIAQLERELAAARGSAPYPANTGAAQAAYQRCLADRRVDCEFLGSGGYDSGDYGYYPAPYYFIGAAYRRAVFASNLPVRPAHHLRRGGTGRSR